MGNGASEQKKEVPLPVELPELAPTDATHVRSVDELKAWLVVHGAPGAWDADATSVMSEHHLHELLHVDEGPSREQAAVSGALEEFPLAELLQHFLSCQGVARLTLTSEGETASLFLGDGRVLAAWCGDGSLVRGMAAIERAATWRSGAFSLATRVQRPAEDMNLSALQVFVALARQEDERRRA